VSALAPLSMLTSSLRPLSEGDLEAALAMLRGAAAGPAYLDFLASAVESASLTPSVENRGIVAELDGTLIALTVYGEYAGASGAGRLHLVAVAERYRRRGLGALLVSKVAEELSARAARFILAELPDDRPALDGYSAFLRACSFAEESRVPDLYRPGVALVFLRRE
jgi:GNAT superfamily N-acetyltransferase